MKDKDSVLRNATTTDSVVPEGEKAVHSNCMAHTHMHVHKIGAVTGTLSNKDTASPQCMARHAALAPGMRLCVAVNTAFAQSMEMVACKGTIKLESDSVRKYPEG